MSGNRADGVTIYHAKDSDPGPRGGKNLLAVTAWRGVVIQLASL
jgi:hypothetical protein